MGTRNMKFCLLGDGPVVAATMEKTGSPDQIHASEDIAFLLPDEDWVESKVVETKVVGVDGQRVQTYLLKV